MGSHKYSNPNLRLRPITRVLYAQAFDDFFAWREGQGSSTFVRVTDQAHRAWLEARGLSPSTINQRLAAIRKLARGRAQRIAALEVAQSNRIADVRIGLTERH